MLPIVETLASATSHQERAEWLLSVPQIYLYREQVDIARILRDADFTPGERLLQEEIACLLTARDGGDLPYEAGLARGTARLRVKLIAREAVRG